MMDARMYDSILLIAHAAQDCVYDKNNLCRVDNATQMMEKLRSARNVEGVASSLRIQPGTNNLLESLSRSSPPRELALCVSRRENL